MFCMESGSKSGKLWLAPLIEPKPKAQRRSVAVVSDSKKLCRLD